eukprot:4659924-Pyramimonas_sp.AAC.1
MACGGDVEWISEHYFRLIRRYNLPINSCKTYFILLSNLLCGAGKCPYSKRCAGGGVFCPHGRKCVACDAWSCEECGLVRGDGEDAAALVQRLRPHSLFLDFDRTLATTKVKSKNGRLRTITGLREAFGASSAGQGAARQAWGQSTK